MFMLDIRDADTATSLSQIYFERYSDLSQYCRDCIEFGTQIDTTQYKVGNIIIDRTDVFMIVGKESYK